MTPSPAPAIEISGLTKRFGAFAAVEDIALAVPKGEFLALLGPSGSGKTTLLRMLAGLETVDAGTVRFAGRDVIDVHARERRIGFVFQHYALFRHMTVFDNVAFGLRVLPRRERPGKAEVSERVTALLERVQLAAFAGRYPNQLSGGQRQRVALARALATRPSILLLDEPFGALDAKVRKELRRWLRQLHEEMGLTSVFVTHDQEEALELADRIAVMSQGRIEQVGKPQAVYDAPASPFVFEFLGSSNRLPCRVVGGRVEVAGMLLRDALPLGISDGEGVAFVRPHDIEVLPGNAGQGLVGRVRHALGLGSFQRAEIELADRTLIEIEAPREGAVPLTVGATVTLVPRHARVFSAGGNGQSRQAAE